MTTLGHWDLTDMNEVSAMFQEFEKDENSSLENTKITMATRKASSVMTRKKKRKSKKRKSIFKGQNIVLDTERARELMFSPSIGDYKLFSPDTGSRCSVKSRIELQNVLKEAYEFLNEPPIKYEPSESNPFNIRNYKYEVVPKTSKPQTPPKVESVEEYIKIRQSQENLNPNNTTGYQFIR